MQASIELDEVVMRLRQLLPSLAAQYHVQTLGVFGSYVRHEQHQDSDLDVLVSFTQPPSLLRFIELEHYLTDALGVKVDLVMRDALKPTIEARVLDEVVPV